jgi:hypothetical protein
MTLEPAERARFSTMPSIRLFATQTCPAPRRSSKTAFCRFSIQGVRRARSTWSIRIGLPRLMAGPASGVGSQRYAQWRSSRLLWPWDLALSTMWSPNGRPGPNRSSLISKKRNRRRKRRNEQSRHKSSVKFQTHQLNTDKGVTQQNDADRRSCRHLSNACHLCDNCVKVRRARAASRDHFCFSAFRRSAQQQSETIHRRPISIRLP